MIKDMLNRLVGVTDIKQSIAWFGSVGVAIGITVAIYIRLGQYIAIQNIRATEERQEIDRLKTMIEPWNEPSKDAGKIIYPADVRKEVLILQKQVKDLKIELEAATDRVNSR